MGLLINPPNDNIALDVPCIKKLSLCCLLLYATYRIFMKTICLWSISTLDVNYHQFAIQYKPQTYRVTLFTNSHYWELVTFRLGSKFNWPLGFPFYIFIISFFQSHIGRYLAATWIAWRMKLIIQHLHFF